MQQTMLDKWLTKLLREDSHKRWRVKPFSNNLYPQILRLFGATSVLSWKQKDDILLN